MQLTSHRESVYGVNAMKTSMPFSVGILLKAGADPAAEDMAGQTPRDLTENKRIIRLLTRATGKDTP